MSAFTTPTPWHEIPKEDHARLIKEMLATRRKENLAEGGSKAAVERAGDVRGMHYVERAPEIHALKRQGMYSEALALILECVDAAERVALLTGMDPAPAYSTYAAIEYRRQKDYAREVAILERYVAACPPGRGDKRVAERLEKARILEAKN